MMLPTPSFPIPLPDTAPVTVPPPFCPPSLPTLVVTDSWWTKPALYSKNTARVPLNLSMSLPVQQMSASVSNIGVDFQSFLYHSPSP